jgi:hypothetical protein
VDMSSLVGGQAVRITGDQIIEGFRTGLHAGKVSQHMTTNHAVAVRGDVAEVTAQGHAWNRVAALGAGRDVWETWGRYRLGYAKTPTGWRVTAFRYVSLRTAGPDAVRTHTA